MKGLSLIFLLLTCILATSFGQSKNIPPLDKSVLDVSYYPVNYPILKIQDKAKDPLIMRVLYSRPQKNGREVFGGLVEYGQIWRVGANEATEIEFYRDVTIGKSKVKKGRYTLYAIPTQDNWTIIVNRDTDTWGAFKYDPKKDVAKIDIKPEKNVEMAEAFSMYFEPRSGGANLFIHWDNVRSALPIGF
jgi:hypothetical protein